MFMLKKTIILLFIAGALFSSAVFADKLDKLDKLDAIDEAKIWLVRFDAGLYAQSHNLTSVNFQNAKSVEAWEAEAPGLREGYGMYMDRDFFRIDYLADHNLGGEGHYYVVTFFSNFTEEKNAVEKLTMAAEDETWKLIGYSIEKSPR